MIDKYESNGPRLECWYVQDNRLLGLVYNDRRFPDGMEVITSTIDMIDEDRGVARTQNTWYTLGEKYVNKLGGEQNV